MFGLDHLFIGKTFIFYFENRDQTRPFTVARVIYFPNGNAKMFISNTGSIVFADTIIYMKIIEEDDNA